VGACEKLRALHCMDIQPGKSKAECPICHRMTFSVKRDNTLGRCFHPACGHVVSGSAVSGFYSAVTAALNGVVAACHQDLLALDRAAGNALSYLVDRRGIEIEVVKAARLGSIPANIEAVVDSAFDNAVELLGNKSADDLQAQCGKLKDLVARKRGWLCFGFTDEHCRVVRLQFRQPYTKDFASFKPFRRRTGVFGLDMFQGGQEDYLMLVEGEFDVLQLQSMTVRDAHDSKKPHSWAYACATGGSSAVDAKTLKALPARGGEPYLFHDNDDAGRTLVERIAGIRALNFMTPPDPGADPDSYIRGFNTNSEAKAAIRSLLQAAEHARCTDPWPAECEHKTQINVGCSQAECVKSSVRALFENSPERYPRIFCRGGRLHRFNGEKVELFTREGRVQAEILRVVQFKKTKTRS